MTLNVENIDDKINIFIREYFEYNENNLDDNTCLYKKFGTTDPDEFEHFLLALSQEFKIKIPVTESKKPEKGNRLLQFLVKPFELAKYDSQIFVAELTIYQLKGIVASGVWPQDWVKGQESKIQN